MREIKFRVWNKDKKEWEKHALGMGTDGALCTNHNEDFELSQFTGLHDKNGKEIYEGDIVKAPAFSTAPTQVQHQHGAFVLVTHDNDGVHVFSFATPNVAKEVIGNIYENPELIKE